MKIVALTTGRQDPSARFRVRQHIEPLGTQGIDVDEYIPIVDKHAGVPTVITDNTPSYLQPAIKAAWVWIKLLSRLPGIFGTVNADLVWLNRELLPGRYTLERFLRKPFVLDVDDAVWRGRPDGANTMSRLGRESRAVIAGNSYIANWFESYAKTIHIVPTAIDTVRFAPSSSTNERQARFTVGWTGTSGNFGYLYEIEAPLKAFLDRYDAQIIIVADTPPQFRRIKPQQMIFMPWTPATEASLLQMMDVGLMPLADTEWTRGKCSFKMLQYMSTGIPVVVSPVGMNREVLSLASVGLPAQSDTDWFDALQSIYCNTNQSHQMGLAGRQLVIERYSRKVVSEQLARIFKSVHTQKDLV